MLLDGVARVRCQTQPRCTTLQGCELRPVLGGLAFVGTNFLDSIWKIATWYTEFPGYLSRSLHYCLLPLLG